MSTAREDILRRIRAALPGEARTVHATTVRSYRRSGSLSRQECLALFIDRLLDYDTEVVEVDSTTELPTAITNVLKSAGEDRLLVAPSFPNSWLPHSVTIMVDNQLSSDEISTSQAVLTPCESAIASSGTILLVHTGVQGRRAMTLLPDHHICLVRRDQVVELLSEALSSVASQNKLPITSIAGPSATSDIEMTRIRGVHGPRRLTVILYSNP